MQDMDFPAPAEGIIATHFVVSADVAASAAFYSKVLGGTIVMEGSPSMVKLANTWIIINEGGGPTDDKPEVVLDVPGELNRVSAFLNLRVADIQQVYADWSERGAAFLTPPIDRGAEIRCYLRDPDGHLIEVGQATGVLADPRARPQNVKQLRLVVEAEDFEAAVAFYRDALGMREEFFVESAGDALVMALQAGRATLEIVNSSQRRLIDELEVGRQVSRKIRVAFEVPDAAAQTTAMVEAGGELIAPPTETPWRSLNSRLEAPAGLQITLFEELEDAAD